MKYAIKVPIDDGWLYVTETDKDGNLIAKTFDTREEAEAFETVAFNSVSLSQVVEYQDNKVDTLTIEEVSCKDHPDAPHGFDRDSSHALDRYVCECENWEPEDE